MKPPLPLLSQVHLAMQEVKSAYSEHQAADEASCSYNCSRGSLNRGANRDTQATMILVIRTPELQPQLLESPLSSCGVMQTNSDVLLQVAGPFRGAASLRALLAPFAFVEGVSGGWVADLGI